MVRLFGGEPEDTQKPKRLTDKQKTTERLKAEAEARKQRRLDRQERQARKDKEKADRDREERLEWLRLNDPDAFKLAILAELKVPHQSRDTLKELVTTIKTARGAMRELGLAESHGGSGSAITDAIRDVVDSVGPQLPALAQALSQRPQTQPATVQPAQPQPIQEAPMPQVNGSTSFDRLVAILTNLVEPPGKGLIDPKEAAEKLRALAETERGKIVGAPGFVVRSLLGVDLIPQERAMLHELVQGMVSDLIQTEATSQAVFDYIVRQNNVESPQLAPLWHWFAGDQARLPWLVEVVHHLRGGAPPVAAGPVEAI